MTLNDSGLPLPGRELDAWICEHILGLNVVHHAWPCGYTPTSCELEAAGFFTKDREPLYPDWSDELHPVYLPEHGTWPLELYEGLPEEEELYCYVKPCPFVSTTHAYHSVMEVMVAKGYEWRFRDNLSWLLAEMDRSWGDERESVEVPVVDYPDREHAYAHAVCAVVWMAERGEDA